MIIGFIDSGVGGLPILEAVRACYPGLQCIYYGDRANFPYGNKSKEQITKYAYQAVTFIQSQGAEIIVIACNTICAVAFDYLVQQFPKIKFINILKTTVDQVLQGNCLNVILLATEATIQSRQYERMLAVVNPNIHVKAVICTRLISLLEQQYNQHATIDELTLKALNQIIDKAQAIVLGCTHFKYIEAELNIRFPNKTIIGSEWGVIYKLKPLLDGKTNPHLEIKSKIIFTDALNEAMVA